MIKTKTNGSSVCEEIPYLIGKNNAHNRASHFDWSEINDSDHLVQFYETDEFLVKSLTDFIAAGLDSGETCIVVATEKHQKSLEEQLRKNGRDTTTALITEQIITLDAAKTLSKIMSDESPDSNRFTKVIGSLVKQAANRGRRVRIFGEMVALLWAENKHHAALQLEELWNKLNATYPFSLFCAYPMSHFSVSTLAEPFNHICQSHTRVIPAESYIELTNTDEQLRTITKLQQKARSLEVEIMERKQAEEALRAVKEELEIQLAEREKSLVREQLLRIEAESANRMKDEFLSTVSHELRAPLNAIIGWTYMLRKEELDKTTQIHAVEIIDRNAHSQAQLIEDILDVSRAITGKLQLNIESVDMASIINAAVDSLRLAVDSKSIQVEMQVDSSAPQALGDANRLQQIIWNLLSNAIKFTPEKGRVSIHLNHINSAIQIKVCDSGQGICPDFLPFIFDRFRQADGTYTRKYGGLGLGLAIVRHLVELHGGTVYAESNGELGGATFTIDLPLAAEKRPE